MDGNNTMYQPFYCPSCGREIPYGAHCDPCSAAWLQSHLNQLLKWPETRRGTAEQELKEILELELRRLGQNVVYEMVRRGFAVRFSNRVERESDGTLRAIVMAELNPPPEK